MRVLVTGAGGFAGSYIAHDLADHGFEVTGLYRRGPGLAAVGDTPATLHGVRADLCSMAELPGVFDAIVHTAATSPWADVGVEQVVRDNVTGTQRLLDLAEQAGCRGFVFFSSLSLYGRIDTAEVDEATPIINPDPYGATKFLGEQLLAVRAERLPGLALRLPAIVGPGARRNWLASTAERLRRGEVTRLFNPDAAYNNAVHIVDIASLVRRAVLRRWTGFDAVVLGAKGSIPVRTAVERLAAALEVEPHLEIVTAPKPSFVLSSRRAIERWGYEPMDIGDLIDLYGSEAKIS